MTVIKDVNDISRGIDNLLEQKFSGEIVIGQEKNRVSVYVSDGKLLWIKDKIHPVRRWHRAIEKSCVDDRTTKYLSIVKKMGNYRQISQAIARQDIELERVKSAIVEMARECFFELLARQSILGQLNWTTYQDISIQPVANLALSAEQMDVILSEANLLEKQWQAAELNDYQPTMSPVLQQEQTYDALEVPIPKNYLQGNITLWDLAAKMQTSIILITRSLINMEKQNIIRFQQIGDLSETPNGSSSPPPLLSQPESRENDSALISAKTTNNSARTNQTRNTSQPAFDPRKPLIACIDDSPVLSHSVKKILESVGYQSMMIPEPLAGMGLLAKYRPNLILLDLLMPTVNGYSVCKFLRETTLFRTTPIVILTSKDTIVDRTRAKLAGATDFITKPPEPQELLQVIRLHIIDVPWS
jgi:two-component system, chemotaxis family, response regulator PixG